MNGWTDAWRWKSIHPSSRQSNYVRSDFSTVPKWITNVMLVWDIGGDDDDEQSGFGVKACIISQRSTKKKSKWAFPLFGMTRTSHGRGMRKSGFGPKHDWQWMDDLPNAVVLLLTLGRTYLSVLRMRNNRLLSREQPSKRKHSIQGQLTNRNGDISNGFPFHFSTRRTLCRTVSCYAARSEWESSIRR